MTYYLYELNDNWMTLIELKVYHKTEIETLNSGRPKIYHSLTALLLGLYIAFCKSKESIYFVKI